MGDDTSAGARVNPWQQYIGRQHEAVERISVRELQGLAALLDHAGVTQLPGSQDALPPFCHWLNANPAVAQSGLGEDGHPRTGDFIPDLPLPRRMWVGSRVQCPGELVSGQPLQHRQTIKSIEPKTGRSGEMIFVTVLHEYFVERQRVLLEEQDLVYRSAGSAGLERPVARPIEEVLAEHSFDWSRSLHPDPVLLFRYSAVSFNGHRIHYDRDYATNTEGYPALVVQGPLTATLLLDLYLCNCPGARISGFSFRGLRPLYDGDRLLLLGRQTPEGANLWALDAHGDLAIEMELAADSP